MIPFKSFNSKQITESETDYNEFVSVLAEEYEMSVEAVETLIEDIINQKNKYRLAGSANRAHRIHRNKIAAKSRRQRPRIKIVPKYILDKKGRKVRPDTKEEMWKRFGTHLKLKKDFAGHRGIEPVRSRVLKSISRMSKSPKKKDNAAMRAFVARSAAIKYKKAKASRPVVKKLKKKTPGQPRRLASASR